MRQILFIANSSAGSSDDADVATALEVLREHADVDVVTTGTVEELTRAIAPCSTSQREASSGCTSM